MTEGLRRVIRATALAVLALASGVWLLGLRVYAAGVLFRALALPLGLLAASALVVAWLGWRAGVEGWPRRAVLALALLVLVPASVALGRGLAFARPSHSTAAEAGGTVTVVTYNVLFRGGDPAASLRMLEREAGADVMLFQEVTPAWQGRLTAALARTHPHSAARAVAGVQGLAVYSRLPLGEPEYLLDGARRPVAQCLTVMAPGAPFLLCNAHLSSPAPALARPPVSAAAGFRSNARVREAQWRDLRELVGRRFAGWRDRLVVAGDLNTLDSEPLYYEMRRDLVDAFRELRWAPGATFPNAVALAPRPLVRIDYVLAAPAIRPVQAQVLPPAGSDHLAVRAVLRVPSAHRPRALALATR